MIKFNKNYNVKRIIQIILLSYLLIVLIDLLFFIGGFKTTSILSRFFDVTVFLLLLSIVMLLFKFVEIVTCKNWKNMILFLLFIFFIIAIVCLSISIMRKKGIDNAYINISNLLTKEELDSNIECDQDIKDMFFYIKKNRNNLDIKITLYSYSILGDSFSFLIQSQKMDLFIINMSREKNGQIIYWIHKPYIHKVKEMLDAINKPT